MSAFALTASTRSRRRKPTLEDRLIARMLGRSLDRELAAGIPARISGAHAARVAQLAADGTRHAVARSLDRLIERAEAPESRRQISLVPCREQVRHAKGLIRATAARLRSAQPIDGRGVARLKMLLSEPTGPCYAPSRPDALSVALRDIARSLDVDG